MLLLKTLITVLALTFWLPAAAETTVLPDKTLTPGEARVVTTDKLCHMKTTSVRNVPNNVKKQVFAEYGLPTGNLTGWCFNSAATRPYDNGCEVDHVISLELGGSNGIKNLGLQKYFGSCNAHDKDHLENKLHELVCASNMPLAEAQHIISTDWEAAYIKYVNPNGCR